MEIFQHQNPICNRKAWLLSLGVFLFAILNTGYSDNMFTAMQEAWQTEWLAIDNHIDQGDTGHFSVTFSKKIFTPKVGCLINVDYQNLLTQVAYYTARRTFLHHCSSLSPVIRNSYSARQNIPESHIALS